MKDEIARQHIEYILRDKTAARREKILREMIGEPSLLDTWAPNSISAPLTPKLQSAGIRTAPPEMEKRLVEFLRGQCWLAQHNLCNCNTGGTNERIN